MRQDNLDFFLHALGTLFRVRRIYPPGKKQVRQAAQQASRRLADWGNPVRMTLLGDDAIVEDRRLEQVPVTLESLLRALRQSGCESVQIEADANDEDLTAWIEHVISKDRTPYRSQKVIAGTLNLEKRVQQHSPSVLAQAVSGYMDFLTQAREALSDLESKKAEGLVRAREIVCAISARLAVGKELFEPIYDLKDYDDYTFTHALNVCVLSSALARTLNLPNVPRETVNTISLAALCHDLGKKQVSREVLNKKGPLAPEEWVSMEAHPSHGARLLLEIPGVQSENPLLPVVAYQHHMGADQAGYPRLPASLKPHRIHSVSLLIAVTDVFDALRTVRPYRPALSIAKATTILLKDAMAGKLHKDYVSTFLSLLKILVPGRKVVLSDGRHCVILEAQPGSPLTPLVEDEEGQLLDLSTPLSPWISEVREEAA